MKDAHMRPAEIERASMDIITKELMERGVVLQGLAAAVIRRVIHTTADFDYAENLQFTENAVERAVEVLQKGTPVITDTNMIRAGIHKASLEQLHCGINCFMAEEEVIRSAREKNTTRAAAAMEKAAREAPVAVLVVGNAPTALLRLAALMEEGLRPALVIGVPVGFVNVVESKTRIFEACQKWKVPAIVAKGRKGGSTVAVAICNALLYTATGRLEPETRA